MGNSKFLQVAEWIIYFIAFGIPMNLFSIYSLKHPEDSIKWGTRMNYKNAENLEPSEFALDCLKFGSIFTLIITNLFFIMSLVRIVRS